MDEHDDPGAEPQSDTQTALDNRLGALSENDLQMMRTKSEDNGVFDNGFDNSFSNIA